MFVDFLLERFAENGSLDALVWKDRVYDYAWLLQRVRYWDSVLESEDISSGTVCSIEGDYSPNSIALFLALTQRACVIVPLTGSQLARRDWFVETAQIQVSFALDESDRIAITRIPGSVAHELYRELARRGHPGLVVFSSGSTGKTKAIVHDVDFLLQKFKERRHRLRTLLFLRFDHLGGLNTMFYILANTGCIVMAQDRSPDSVLALVERHGVELLPTTPTFMNMILLSEAHRRYDLSKLRLVSYGTEPMPRSTLQRFHELFPHIRLLQTYGLSEVGVLRSRSESSDSLWVKVGGEGFQTRVVDGTLQLKADSAMLGYLNEPSPFSPDGWLDTGDLVEVKGEYVRFLGRKSEVINVGGEKVFPAEVENVIQELDEVKEVAVHGEQNPITGNIVCAKVRPSLPVEDSRELIQKVKRHCRKRLQNYKVPVKVTVVEEPLVSERFKKIRSQGKGARNKS